MKTDREELECLRLSLARLPQMLDVDTDELPVLNKADDPANCPMKMSATIDRGWNRLAAACVEKVRLMRAAEQVFVETIEEHSRERKAMIVPFAGKYLIGENPLIGRYLDVSTCHVLQSDMKRLKHDEKSCLPHLLADSYPEGGWVNTGLGDIDHDDDELRDRYSESMFRLLKIAWDNDCVIIRLDADGTVYEDLEQHTW